MNDSPETPVLQSYRDYLADLFRRDPHGLNQESKEVEEATRGAYDAFWRWADGSPVGCVIFFNFGAAIKVARRYNFELPADTVAAHARMKTARETETRAFGHEFSFRHPAPQDTQKDTLFR